METISEYYLISDFRANSSIYLIQDNRSVFSFRFSKKWKKKRHNPFWRNKLTSCPVCLLSFRRGQKLTQFNGCGHIFHEECCQLFFAKNPKREENCLICGTHKS